MPDIRERMVALRKERLLKLSQKTDFKYKDLNPSEEDELLKNILSISEDRQNILIFKHYYKNTFKEIEDIFDIENAKGEYINLVCILSENLGIEKAIISEKSMKNVCERAASNINDEIMQDFNAYSNSEIKQTHKTKIAFRFGNSIKRQVASIILLVFISSGLLLGSNAYAEGKVFEWIINTFEKYTSFNIEKENETNKSDAKIEISYIPEGFELNRKTSKNSMDIYYYKNKNNHIVIKFIYDSLNTGLNTENENKDEFEYEGNKIITWEKSSKNYFVFIKNEVACQIYGNLDKDEFIKIYNSIIVKDE